MKFKTFDLRVYRHNDETLLSFDIKGGRIPLIKLLHIPKSKPLTAFDLISADDVIELSNELGVSEDKLTYAVLEVISKRKNGGMA